MIIFCLIYTTIIALLLAIKIDKLEDRFYQKHEADVRYRDQETAARVSQGKAMKQKIHRTQMKIRDLDTTVGYVSHKVSELD